jgi:hypothetical protein
MNKDAVMIVRGFLQLPNLEKKKVVDKINHYFDEINEREAIRDDLETKFKEIGANENGIACKCCGRT